MTALASLSNSDRELLMLVAWHGLSPRQAASVLGCRDRPSLSGCIGLEAASACGRRNAPSHDECSTRRIHAQ